MNISEAILFLQDIQKELGDIEIITRDSNLEGYFFELDSIYQYDLNGKKYVVIEPSRDFLEDEDFK
ncbi:MULTISPECIES: hypothetical protein [unclassified Helicobacter]|uniref:hypothetical protein n=1 Tax=unclassified Helicobacter TaxID=2593540 RepID=UPI000CF19938|nr:MULTISPECIES: hypothetical protein [unclassified Helicobacter]